MALRGASTTVDTDFIDWMSLAVEGAAVCCTVNSIEPSKDYGQGTAVEAPRAQVIILTGKQAGVVYPNELVLKAGIRNKLTEIGDSVVGRMATYTRGKQAYPCLNNEQPGDLELAEEALERVNGGAKETAKKAPAKKTKVVEVEVDDDEDGDEPPF